MPVYYYFQSLSADCQGLPSPSILFVYFAWRRDSPCRARRAFQLVFAAPGRDGRGAPKSWFSILLLRHASVYFLADLRWRTEGRIRRAIDRKPLTDSTHDFDAPSSRDLRLMTPHDAGKRAGRRAGASTRFMPPMRVIIYNIDFASDIFAAAKDIASTPRPRKRHAMSPRL